MPLLLGSNLYWIYAGVDQAVTEKYNEPMPYERLEARAASQEVILNLGADHSREALVRRVSVAPSPHSDAFERDAWVVIGRVRRRFDEADRLVEAGPNLAQERSGRGSLTGRCTGRARATPFIAGC